MKKRLLSLLLVVCMSLTIFPMEALALTMQDIQKMTNKEKLELLRNPFEDVSEKDWFYDAIQYVRINGIFNGVSETAFDPQGTLTRGMFVTVLGRMAGVDKENYEGQSVFADVPAEQYYAPYVAWAYKHGITTGTSEDAFSPNAPVSRQQMATFFVRYFDAFGISYDTGIKVESTPADLHLVADWAKAAVLKLWETGLLNGDGVSFDPASNATRAETATLCMRTDGAVEVWYKEPGEPSGRVAIDPKKIKLNYATTESVYFFDDTGKCFDEISTWSGSPLGHMPPVEKYSRPGKVLVGYYLDKEYTKPFYAENPVNNDTVVYAKYQDMQDDTVLNLTTFTQMDQDPDLTFEIERISGNTSARNAAELIVKDGSEMVELSITGSGDTYTVRAVGGFNEGCTYELQLKDGWIFSGKPETIRTASFSIAMDEVNNLTMGKDIVYLQDESGDILDVLSAYMNSESRKNTFAYDGDDLAEGDILCVYMGAHPEDRADLANDDDPENDIALTDPALYVKVEDVDAGIVEFAALDEQDQLKLYEIPDVFTFYVDTMPAGAGAVDLETLDISFYETAYGKEEGTLEKAKTKVNEGDFVAFYTDLTDGEDSEVFYGRVTGYANGTITYKASSEEELLNCMDLYSQVDLDGEALIDDALAADLEAQLYAQVEESGFAEEAAYMLADVVAGTDNFNEAITISEFMLADREGRALSRAQVRDLARGGFAIRPNSIKLDVDLIRDGDQLHFKNGVQMAINIEAELELFVSEGTVVIDLAATFVEEVELKPTVKGELTYTEIIIPIPNGVQVTANIDIKNYTAMSFDAEVYTLNQSSDKIGETIRVTEELLNFMDTAEEEGLDTAYYDGLEALLQKYSEMVTKETDWVRLVEQEIFTAEVCIAGICIGVETNFVVRADMSIALGSNLEYEVGKRYSFWFRIGLYKPTAGSETTDLIDESFAFRFYVLGKLGVKAGVNAKLYVGIGTGKLASVGIKAEMGPYVKLWGFFIYDYSKYRPAGSPNWTYVNQRHGALCTEFGLYFMLSFEAEALSLFEYSYDFLDEEVPILNAGAERFYYDMNYKPEEDEVVVVRDEDGDSRNGITMELPESVRALSYLDLETGRRGSEALPYSNYKLSITNEYFSINKDGKITVNPPQDVRYLECDLTITYLNGKMAFSDYDMTVTLPLVWTNLGMDELKEYYTAAVRVGNDADGYDTVWTKKVLKRQPFDLPSAEEIQTMIGWDALKYKANGGYGSQALTGLTIIEDSSYEYKIDYPTYEIEVEGVQNKNGSTKTMTFEAKYGETFDFSSLKNTGTSKAGEKYTKFTHVTMMLDGEEVDLRKPIDLRLAQALKNGDVEATANYIDDSVTAVFTFVGITEPDVVVTLRKGETPDTDNVVDVIERKDAEGNRVYDDTVVISEITPALGAISQSTNYMVTCAAPSGHRNDVHFDLQGGTPPEIAPWDKLVGSLLVNLPTEEEVSRTGYDFDGWYTEPKDLPKDQFGQTGENALTQTVPHRKYSYPISTETPETSTGLPLDPDASGEVQKPTDGLRPTVPVEPTKPIPGKEIPYTIYAQWTPKTFEVKFDLNGGEKLLMRDDAADTTIDPKNDEPAPNKMTVVYDSTFGKAYAYTEDAVNLKDLSAADFYGVLPTAYRNSNCTFGGWYIGAEKNGTTVDFSNATLVTEDTPVEVLEDTVLYARWKSLVEIPKNIYAVDGKEVTYRESGYTPTITYNNSITGTYYYLDNPDTTYPQAYPTAGFVIDYMREGSEQYVRRSENPHVAGTYFTCIERPADETYAKMSWTYTDADQVLRIEKAESSLDGTLTAEVHGRAVIPTLDITSKTGDGPIEYKVGSNGTWSNTGVIYNLNPGTYTVYARLGEGMNYHASDDYITTTVEVTANNTFQYKLVVTTGSGADDGTDAKLYATIGGTETKLPEAGFEGGDTDVCTVKIPNDLSLNGSVDVNIRIEEAGIGWHWYLKYLQMDIYDSGSVLHRGTQNEVRNEFDDDGENHTYTLENSHLGRNVDESSYDLSYNGSYIRIDDTLISDNYKSNYDPYDYPGAPRLVAYFSNSIFNAYITRNSLTEFYVDWAGVRNAMDEYRISQLTLTYGIDCPDSAGIYGAPDDLRRDSIDLGHLSY